MNNIAHMQPQGGSLQALGQVHSVLGERQARIPTGGKIRAGIKVIKSAVANNETAVDIYERGVAAGAAWDVIDNRIQKQCGINKACLVPKATEHFGVKRADFSVPEMADRILELYGEDRGEGVKLYKFPVIFALDTWLANMPHGLKAFTSSDLRFWSEYATDGTRFCNTRKKVEIDPRSKRARRAFGGRPKVILGQCKPNQCPEYQADNCKLSGSLIFFIPNIPGSSAIELSIKSYYAMEQWRQQMGMVALLLGGKISGLLNDKPIFWLTKKRDSISMIDPITGQAKRRKAWIVHLEADIPMDRMFESTEQLSLAPGTQAAAALSYQHESHGDLPVDSKPVDEPIVVEHSAEDAAAIKEARASLSRTLENVGIEQEKFGIYAIGKFGEDWSHTLNTLKVAETEVTEAAATDIDGYIDQVYNPAPF